MRSYSPVAWADMKHRLAGLLFLLILSHQYGPLSAAERRCEWVGAPQDSATYSNWVDDSRWLPFWKTYIRDCCEVTWGEALWITTVFLRQCTPAVGTVVGQEGPGSEEGFSYVFIENIVSSEQAADTVRVYEEDYDLKYPWSDPPENSAGRLPTLSIADTTIWITMYTRQNVINGFDSAAVTFDSEPLPLGSKVRLDTAGVGLHELVVVNDVPGLHVVDSLTIMIDVLASYTLEYIGDSTDVSPMGIVRFTNLSPDSVFADFQASALQLGLEVELLDNQRVVQSGESVDLVVQFYTAPGYVATPGQELIAMVTAHAAQPGGNVLASTTAFGYATSGATGIANDRPPALVALGQNTPNPFADRTTIPFRLPQEMNVELAVYDVQGRRVRTIKGRFGPGENLSIVWTGRDDRGRKVASGVYFYRMTAGGQTFTRRAVVIR